MYSDFVRGFLIIVRNTSVMDIRQLFVHHSDCDEMARARGVRSGSEHPVTVASSDSAGQYFPFLLASFRDSMARK
jgi:hypothetical protein